MSSKEAILNRLRGAARAQVAADLARLIEGEFASAPRVRAERERPLLRTRLPEAFARLLSPLL